MDLSENTEYTMNKMASNISADESSYFVTSDILQLYEDLLQIDDFGRRCVSSFFNLQKTNSDSIERKWCLVEASMRASGLLIYC